MLRGTVCSGVQQAAGFLAVPWVAEQLFAQIGFRPYPGTLNLKLSDEASLGRWRALRLAGSVLRLRSPDPAFCDATCFAVAVGGDVPGAIVVPHVEGYPDDAVEVVAAERLRDKLGLSDGDECVLILPRPFTP